MPEVTPSPSFSERSPESPSSPSAEVETHDREAAWRLLNRYTESASLLKHALSVEVCVRAYGEQRAVELGLPLAEARALVETYAVTGLLHDFDYEKYPSPEEHPWIGNRILTEQGWPEEVRHAIMGHAEYTHTPRESHLDKVLFRLRRTGRISDRQRTGQTHEIHPRRERAVCRKKDERQGICPRRQSR